MDASFDLEIHATHLHIKHPPGFVVDAAAASPLWRGIAELCRGHDRSKVLIEAHGPIRLLDTMSAFEAGRVAAENLSGLTVAICLHDHKFDDLTSFFKTVAQNRGAKIEIFSELGKALRWLDVHTGENAARGG